MTMTKKTEEKKPAVPVYPGSGAIEITHPKGYRLYLDLVEVTPAIASAYLDAIHERQRNLVVGAMKKLERAVLQDGFTFTGDTIKFNEHGHLVDGQHRLTTVIKTGKPLTSMVIHGLRLKSFAELGEHSKWTPDAHLRAEFPDLKGDVKCMVAAMNCLHRWNQSTGEVRGSYYNTTAELSNAEYAEFFKTLNFLEEASRIAQRLRGKLGTPPGPITAAVYRLYEADHEAASEFFERLETGVNLTAGMSVLRDRLIKDSAEMKVPGRRADTGRWRLIAFIIKTWNTWQEKKDIKILKWNPNKEPFPVIYNRQVLPAEGTLFEEEVEIPEDVPEDYDFFNPSTPAPKKSKVKVGGVL
jgi:hypothetical protein